MSNEKYLINSSEVSYGQYIEGMRDCVIQDVGYEDREFDSYDEWDCYISDKVDDYLYQTDAGATVVIGSGWDFHIDYGR